MAAPQATRASMANPSVSNSFAMQSQLSDQQKSSEWYVKPEDKVNYMKMFRNFDKNNSGNLSSQEMQEVMLMTKLD